MNTNYFEMLAYMASSLILLLRLASEALNSANECTIEKGTAAGCFVFFSLQIVCIGSGLILSHSMATDLKWKRYYFLGTLVSTQQIYRTYELFIAVLRLDIQCSIIILLTGLVYFSSPNAGPYGGGALAATVIMGFLEFIWERLASLAVRGENSKAMFAMWALSPWLPVSILVAATVPATNPLFSDLSNKVIYSAVVASCVLFVVFRGLTLFLSIRLYARFGPSYVPLLRLLQADASLTPTARLSLGSSPPPPAPTFGVGAVVVENLAASAAAETAGVTEWSGAVVK